MKKLYLFLVLFAIPALSYSADDPAESKKVFATDGTVWNILYKWNYEPLLELSYALIGDTTIAGRQYNKLYALSDSTLVEPRKHRDYYVGGFREENQQVWFRPGRVDYVEEIDEFIMYDFSRKVGDQFDHEVCLTYPGLGKDFNFTGLTDNTTIIKEISVDEQGRRHFKIESYPFATDREWIEGIGGDSGLFWSYVNVLVGGSSWSTEVLCVKQNEKIIYQNNLECNRCFCNDVTDVVVGLQTLPSSQIEVILSPNPVSDQINVSISDEVVPCTFNVFTTTGEYVTGKRLTKAQDQLSMMGMKAGLYIYRMVTDGGELLDSGKVIKE